MKQPMERRRSRQLITANPAAAIAAAAVVVASSIERYSRSLARSLGRSFTHEEDEAERKEERRRSGGGGGQITSSSYAVPNIANKGRVRLRMGATRLCYT